MLSRFLKSASTPQKDHEPKEPKLVQLPESPEEHIAKAIKYAEENNFPKCISHLTSFTSGWTSLQEQDQHVKMKLGSQLEELNQIVRRKLEDLLRGDEHTTVCSACRILSCLQSMQPNASENEGLEIYLDFLEKMIHKDATEFMKLLVQESDTTTSATALADLFSIASSLIHDALPLVQHFSSDAANQVVIRVNKQCSSHVTNIFDLFSEELNLIDTVQQIQTQNQTQAPLSENVTSLFANPLQLDETLQTISLMCAYASRYITFIHSKTATADCSGLLTAIHVMLGHYLALESFYLEKAMGEVMASCQDFVMPATTLTNPAATASPKQVSGKGSDSAHRHSQPNATQFTTVPDSKRSFINSLENHAQLVDDAFFILKKCLRRGLSTMSSNVACAMLNSAAMVLEAPYFSDFAIALERGSVLPTDTYLELLNDLELTLDYIAKLQRDMIVDITRLFTNTTEKTKLVACLDDLVKSATNSCSKLRNKNLASYGDKLNAKIEASFISLIRPTSYEMDESAYEQAEINDPFMQKNLEFLTELLFPVQQKLRDANKAELALNVAKFISTKFEGALLAKKFTSLGAVQLSKEIRQLGDYFVAVGGQPLRYQFTKLAQISQLLNLDRVIDCMEYWIEGKSVFKLDANEVRLVLARRVDFAVESINALKL